MPSFVSCIIVVAVCLSQIVVGQLSGSVGPLTSSSTKRSTKTCNVLNYGGKGDGSTDIGPAITSAFNACKSGGIVYIPPGNYAMATFVTLSGGQKWGLQLDGIISRTAEGSGNMFFIEHSTDFEFFSSSSKGAIQGNGYQYHQKGSISGPRILRLYEVTDFSVHDIALVDSPSFHFTMDTCSNDECVTVKSPSKNVQIESVYCNWSGGCAIGSLGANTNISQVTYSHVYTWSSNQMMMIKSNGGSGSVSNVQFNNFIGHGNAYSLNIDQYWSSQSPAAGNGVHLDEITFNNWKGTELNGIQRGPLRIICSDGNPCTDINVTDFAMWTESGKSQLYSCRSAYGSGFCLKSETSSHKSYAVTTITANAAPSGYAAPTMAADLKTAFGTTQPIPIPSIPTSYFPGIQPHSRLAGSS